MNFVGIYFLWQIAAQVDHTWVCKYPWLSCFRHVGILFPPVIKRYLKRLQWFFHWLLFSFMSAALLSTQTVRNRARHIDACVTNWIMPRNIGVAYITFQSMLIVCYLPWTWLFMQLEQPIPNVAQDDTMYFVKFFRTIWPIK